MNKNVSAKWWNLEAEKSAFAGIFEVNKLSAILNNDFDEFFRYLHGLLQKHATVTEQNRGLLVEALRAISEILIWGDQNDSTVFE